MMFGEEKEQKGETNAIDIKDSAQDVLFLQLSPASPSKSLSKKKIMNLYVQWAAFQMTWLLWVLGLNMCATTTKLKTFSFLFYLSIYLFIF